MASAASAAGLGIWGVRGRLRAFEVGGVKSIAFEGEGRCGHLFCVFFAGAFGARRRLVADLHQMVLRVLAFGAEIRVNRHGTSV